MLKEDCIYRTLYHTHWDDKNKDRFCVSNTSDGYKIGVNSTTSNFICKTHVFVFYNVETFIPKAVELVRRILCTKKKISEQSIRV